MRNKAVRGEPSSGAAAIRAEISLRDGVAQTYRWYVNVAGAAAAASKVAAAS